MNPYSVRNLKTRLRSAVLTVVFIFKITKSEGIMISYQSHIVCNEEKKNEYNDPVKLKSIFFVIWLK